MDRKRARELRNEITQKLQELMGPEVKVSLTSVSYGPDTWSAQINVEERLENGCPADFARLAPKYGLTPDDYLRIFYHQGLMYTINGINPRARTYPIITKRSDGKAIKFGAHAIKSLLEKSS